LPLCFFLLPFALRFLGFLRSSAFFMHGHT
jgi:hypothetical protein